MGRTEKATGTMFCPRCERDAPLQRGRRLRFAAHLTPDGEECWAGRCSVSAYRDYGVVEAAVRFVGAPSKATRAELERVVRRSDRFEAALERRRRPVAFLACEQCGNEQADMGGGVACEECGALMPEASR